MTAMAALLLLLAPPQAAGGLMSYDQTVRCAGLAQAASELEGGESVRGRELFDAALYWSLAATQAAAAANRPAPQADAEQTRARIDSVAALNGGGAAAREALEVCLSRTPDLG